MCTEIMNGSVVVILIHPEEEKSLASATSYALGFYDVPVISVSSRDVEFSDKVSQFLRTAFYIYKHFFNHRTFIHHS